MSAEASDHDRLAAIEQRLASGDERMDRMETALADNTALTKEVHDLMEAAKAGFRVIGGIGRAVAVVAKWIAPVATAAAAVYALFHTIKTGSPPPKP